MTITAQAEIHETRRERIQVLTSYHFKDTIKKVPGAKWDADERTWTVPLSWPACLALRDEFGTGLEIGPELKEWARDTAKIKNELIALRHRVDGDVELPELLMFDKLLKHQRIDAYAIALARRYLLMNETGTGKTWSALAGMALIQHQEPTESIFPLLIMAPKSMVLKWGEEAKLFFPDADIRTVQGTPTKIKKALEPGGDIYCIGWDSIRRYSRQSAYGSIAIDDKDKVDKELNAIPFTSAIVDESHRGQNGTSQRTRAAWYATAGVKNIVSMTGTPMQDSIEDLWAVLRLAFPGDYPTKTPYVERFCDVVWNQWGGREIEGLQPRTKDEFLKNFDAISRRVSKDMALDLPEKLYSVRWVDLPSKNRKAYNEMKNSLVADLENGAVAAENVLVRASYLLALANSWGEVDADGKLSLMDPSPKLDAFMDDVEEGDFAGQSVVVFTDSRQIADMLSARMTKKKIEHVTVTGGVTGEDRHAAVQAFQNKEVPFIIVTRAGGEGITLTAAATMVRLVRSWSYTIHKQAEDRVHRIGSEIHDQVLYIDYISKGTVEEGQLVRLNAKAERSQEVLRDQELLDMLKDDED